MGAEISNKPTNAAHDAQQSGHSSRLARICGRMPEPAAIITAAVIAGSLAGCASFLLKSGISRLGHLLTAHLAGDIWLMLLFPLAGMAMSVAYQKLAGEDLSRGTDQLKERIGSGRFSMKRSLMWNPLVACLITVGFGGSAGSEGPCAVSGAAIGSRAAKWFGLSPRAMRILLGCGAGAGIAGIFKSPVGGMLFTIEVLRMELSATAMTALVSSCLAAFSSAYILSGFTWDVGFAGRGTFDPSHIGWMALLGLVCGIYSLYYNKTLTLTAKFLSRISNRWKRAAIAGTALSLMVFLLPPMFGEGYGVVDIIINHLDTPFFGLSPFSHAALNPTVSLTLIAAILLLKGMAVGAVNYGGGVAGQFAPTLFAGCLVGYLFATTANAYGVSLPTANFALMGMAAVMAGTIKAPMMAVFIAAEISDSYSFILGFILVSVIAYIITARPFRLIKH